MGRDVLRVRLTAWVALLVLFAAPLCLLRILGSPPRPNRGGGDALGGRPGGKGNVPGRDRRDAKPEARPKEPVAAARIARPLSRGPHRRIDWLRVLRDLVHMSWRVTATTLAVGAFTVPVYLFISSSLPDVPQRLTPPALTSPLHTGTFPSYRDAIPILTYHDVSDRPGRFTVTPEAFARQMKALDDAGFTTITAGELSGFLLRGLSLPDRPIALTFDDGLGSAWRAADPILAQHDMHAILFLIGARIRDDVPASSSYYLSADELEKLAASGRWDVESHTHDGHREIQIDANGARGAFLANRAWLVDKARLETIAEFTGRIAADLDASIRDGETLAGRSPTLFSFPFSVVDFPTNDVAATRILRSVVARRFPISVVDADAAQFVTRAEASLQLLPRFEVFSSTTAAELIDRLERARPVEPDVPRALDRPEQWSFEGGPNHLLARAITNGVLSLPAATRHWVAAYWSPAQSLLWRDYRVQVVVENLGLQGDGADATLLLGGPGKDARLAVTLSSGRIRIEHLEQGARTELTRLSIPAGTSHELEVVAAGHDVTVTVDGARTASLSLSFALRGGVGLGVWRETTDSPRPAFRRLAIAPLGRRAGGVGQLASLLPERRLPTIREHALDRGAIGRPQLAQDGSNVGANGRLGEDEATRDLRRREIHP